MTRAQLESRVAVLEKQVAELVKATQKTSGKSWLDSAGLFANDPVFEEAMRLGRDYRLSLRKKAQASAKRGKRART